MNTKQVKRLRKEAGYKNVKTSVVVGEVPLKVGPNKTINVPQTNDVPLTEEQQKRKTEYNRLKRAYKTPQQKRQDIADAKFVQAAVAKAKKLNEQSKKREAARVKREQNEVAPVLNDLQLAAQVRKAKHIETVRALELSEALVRAEIEEAKEKAEEAAKEARSLVVKVPQDALAAKRKVVVKSEETVTG